MKFPFLLLTWGEFPITKKLFIYEQEQKLVLPIFYDGKKATTFADKMEKISKQSFGLEIYSCADSNKALDLFKILIMNFKVNHLIIDPTSRKKKLKNISKIIDDLHNRQD